MEQPVSLIGQVLDAAGYYTSKTTGGQTLIGHIKLRSNYPTATPMPIPLLLEHDPMRIVGECHRMEVVAGAPMLAATVYAAPAAVIDWAVPRFFSLGGTCIRTIRGNPHSAAVVADLDFTELDEVSLVETAAADCRPVRLIRDTDFALRPSRGGWPTNMSSSIGKMLDRTCTEARMRSITPEARRSRILIVHDEKRPSIPPIVTPLDKVNAARAVKDYAANRAAKARVAEAERVHRR